MEIVGTIALILSGISIGISITVIIDTISIIRKIKKNDK